MQAGDGHGPDRGYRVRVAASKSGIVSAFDINVTEDLVAYGGRGGISKPATALTGPYRVDSVRYGGDIVLTGKTNQVPFRGAGQSPHNFVLERVMDQISRELSIDPVESRMRNYIRKDEFPYRTPSGSIYDSGDYEAGMELLTTKADLPALRAERDRARRRTPGRDGNRGLRRAERRARARVPRWGRRCLRAGRKAVTVTDDKTPERSFT